MISVAEATRALLDLAAPLPSETVPLRRAAGRAMARTLTARHNQPPFAASAMDGYAIAREAAAGDTMPVVGESAAGHPFTGPMEPGAAVRIFTGGTVPEGAMRVVIQEDVTRDGDTITLTQGTGGSTHIRPAGGDFTRGTAFRATGLLGSRDIALLAAMGHGLIPVVRRPSAAIIMTGDELCAPDEDPAPGQITASNGHGLAAMFEAAGAEARILPIARDTQASLGQAFALARGADLVVTIGGASVGDHDLVAPAARDAGMQTSFHKVAMRPGKPLMAGRMSDQILVGLPGNPVSAMICGVIFILPMLRKMLGLETRVETREARLAAALPANGPRQHYMRAYLDGQTVTLADSQDSSLLRILGQSNVLVLRPPNDPARAAGDMVHIVPLPA